MYFPFMTNLYFKSKLIWPDKSKPIWLVKIKSSKRPIRSKGLKLNLLKHGSCIHDQLAFTSGNDKNSKQQVGNLTHLN